MSAGLLMKFIPIMKTKAQAANLLQNGDFESGVASPWSGITNSNIVSTDKHSGNYSARITSDEATQLWINVTPGKTYVLRGWYKWVTFTGNQWGYDRLNVFGDNWIEVATINNIHNLFPTGVWNEIALTFVPTTSRIGVNFGMFGPQDSVEIYFDDLQLVEKIGNQTPSLSPIADQASGSAPFQVQFTANADDSDGAIKTFRWEFGDGGESRDPNPMHTYLFKGGYTAKLTVYDNDGASASGTIGVTVNNANSVNVTINSPTDNDSYSTNSAGVTLSGNATSVIANIGSLTWENISTNKSGNMNITSSKNVSWNTGLISLKPGENEILITAEESSAIGGGRVGTDKIIVTRQVSGPSISNVSVNSTNIARYGKYEVDFNLDTVAKYKFFRYDENPPEGIEPRSGVTAEAIINLPNGQFVHQPAFYITDVNVSGTGDNTYYEETANNKWAIRYSPSLLGTHQISLHVQDASGQVTTSVGNFTAVSSTKSGFVNISPADSRYFQFSNGDLFFPIGPLWAVNNQPGAGMNFVRPWMGGEGAYSTNWARWFSSSEDSGNEGPMQIFSYTEHYPGKKLSYPLWYPQGFRFWISGWSSGPYHPKFQTGKTYQVVIRYKTQNIQGPRVAGQPYGFTIKMHGFQSSGDPPDTVDFTLRNKPEVIPHITSNQDWHTLVTNFTKPSSIPPYENDLSLYLDNVTSGEVNIDYFSMKEMDANGNVVGGELIRDPSPDMYSYVDQRPAKYFDDQLTSGEQNGFYYKYVVQDKNDWIPNHLSTEGVFVNVGGGYYQNIGRASHWLQEQWWRYLIARWGYSTSVHSWELNNEGAPDNGTGEHARMTQEFAKFMHDNDPQKHLATTSFWCCWMPTFWGDKTNFPDVNYADWHRYLETGGEVSDIPNFINTIGKTVHDSDIGKPAIIGESGMNLDVVGPTDPNLSNGIWFHDYLWAQVGANGVSFPNYWWSEHFRLISGGVAGISLPFSKFIGGLDLNKGGYSDIVPVSASSNSNIRIFGQVNFAKGKAHAWVQNRNHSFRNTNPAGESGTVKVRLTPSTFYDVEWWNTYTGTTTKSETLTSDSIGDLTLNISNLASDLAVKIVNPNYIETPSGTPTPTPNPGDGNNDGKVDGVDYTIWLIHFNQSISGGGSVGDYNSDGTIDGLDYVVWLIHYNAQ